MSQEALRELLDKVESDDEFVAHLKKEPVKALARLGVSSTEVFTLTCADEDALRRLLGTAEDARSVDFSLFAEAAMPMFDEEMAAAIGEANAGGDTCKVSTATVTKCCWTV